LSPFVARWITLICVSGDRDPPEGSPPRAWREAMARAVAAALEGLRALEAVQRRLHPPDLPALRGELAPLARQVAAARDALAAAGVPAGLEPFHAQLSEGVGRVAEAASLLAEPGGPADGVVRVLSGLRMACRAQESLYPLRLALPPLGRFFAAPEWHARLPELDPEPPEGVTVGVHAAGPADGRGGFHLYVPERYTAARDWPLVVALHGGMGSGRDFLWTWLREARSRGFLLLAPSSQGTTWSLMGPDVDEPALRSMLDYVAGRWRVDRTRVLLTGLSDGGSYALLAGLAEGAPYTALACVSGVLHPRSAAGGALARAAGRRIYLCHGALDWMFPVALARAARDVLVQAGADLTYRELADLSHTYPREENARILEWFDPRLE
jgi:phospholipase/carboxylesterase